jgi:hypothetical protein
MVPNLILNGLTGSVSNYDNLASPSSISNPPNPAISLPVRNRSFSSTPRLIESASHQAQHQQMPTLHSGQTHSYLEHVQSARQRPLTSNTEEKLPSTAYSSYSNNGFNSERTNHTESRVRQSDSRLIIPVQHKASNVSISSSTNSIIDESKSLLREYEQLRSDSVSEIQRAHDSLNAR